MPARTGIGNVTIRELAGTPVATLRRAGLVSGGDPAGDAALDSAFAATSFLLDYF
jgi:hypothetical protein